MHSLAVEIVSIIVVPHLYFVLRIVLDLVALVLKDLVSLQVDALLWILADDDGQSPIQTAQIHVRDSGHFESVTHVLLKLEVDLALAIDRTESHSYLLFVSLALILLRGQPAPYHPSE